MYNVENFFDVVNDPRTKDDAFTPNGKQKWNLKRYYHKLRKISSVISQMGKNYSCHPPALLGLVEVENASVVNDLLNHTNIRHYNYDFVHYESNDERGIDVSLIYDRDLFEEIESNTHTLHLLDEDGSVDYTRDILEVKGYLNGELTHIIVNHWPSRREGEKESRYKRIEAAKQVHEIINTITFEEEDPKVIIMGDFNDDPSSESIEKHLVTDAFYNPMKALHKKGKGTLTYDGNWHLFDQIIVSKNFFNSNGAHHFASAHIFDRDWLRSFKGKYKNSPFRTYTGPWYLGGFSDHFPVFLTFEKNE